MDELGPLAPLAGTWEGAEGLDVSFSHSQAGAEETPFRERISFEPFGPVNNGEQVLHGLDYRASAWRIGEDDPFHMEVGYWLWDGAAGQVMRCFMVPRGSTLIAGGAASPGDRELRMSAEAGSEVYGILSNPYLAEAARSVRYELTVRIEEDGVFSYEEDTVLAFRGEKELFHHTDRNRLQRV